MENIAIEGLSARSDAEKGFLLTLMGYQGHYLVFGSRHITTCEHYSTPDFGCGCLQASKLDIETLGGVVEFTHIYDPQTTECLVLV